MNKGFLLCTALPIYPNLFAMVDLSQYSNKDAKLIRENDGKTPYELLELGLSQAAFTRLQGQLEEQRKAPSPKSAQPEPKQDAQVTPENPSADNADANAPLKPTEVETVPMKSAPAKPKLGPTSATQNPLYSKNTVRVVGPSGIPQTMNATSAQRLIAQRPGEYRIIS